MEEIEIEAGQSERHYWRDLWRFRELFYFLAWRDILVRYKQTVIGIAWSVLRPLVTMLVLTFVFGHVAKIPSGGEPYPILVFVALLPWQFFSSALSECAGSLITNSNLISKIYFPRLIVPASTVIVTLVDFLISVLLLVALMAWYQYLPTWRVMVLPLLVLLAFATAMGFGLWLGALTVKYRDFRYVVPFIVQFGLYISPVGFSSSSIPEQWRLLFYLNPLAGIIDGFRWALLAKPTPIYQPGLLLSFVVVVIALFSGIRYFRNTEKGFADVI